MYSVFRSKRAIGYETSSQLTAGPWQRLALYGEAVSHTRGSVCLSSPFCPVLAIAGGMMKLLGQRRTHHGMRKSKYTSSRAPGAGSMAWWGREDVDARVATSLSLEAQRWVEGFLFRHFSLRLKEKPRNNAALRQDMAVKMSNGSDGRSKRVCQELATPPGRRRDLQLIMYYVLHTTLLRTTSMPRE
jgi:hypothetical protein